MKVVVASTNPVKIKAALEGLRKIFPNETIEISGVSVSSGVSEQPMSSDETLTGALGRVVGAKLEVPQADYWVGFEGGVEIVEDEMRSVVWVVVSSRTRLGKANAGSFVVPPKIADLVRNGMEMGPADDLVFGQTNSKQKNGGVGILTHGVIDRAALYEIGMVLALIPFINPDLYI